MLLAFAEELRLALEEAGGRHGLEPPQRIVPVLQDRHSPDHLDVLQDDLRGIVDRVLHAPVDGNLVHGGGPGLAAQPHDRDLDQAGFGRADVVGVLFDAVDQNHSVRIKRCAVHEHGRPASVVPIRTLSHPL